MRLHLHRVQSHRAQTVQSRAGHKHPGLGEGLGPGGVQGAGLWPHVEQDQEVDATPGAQEGQDWGGGGRGGVGGGVGEGGGGVEGEEGEAAQQQSFFSGSGATQGGEEGHSRMLWVLLALEDRRCKGECAEHN